MTFSDYGLAIDGNVLTTNPVTKQRYTLVSAFREAEGCANAHVYKRTKMGWLPVVKDAGTLHNAVHVQTGYRFVRRDARPGALSSLGGYNRRRNREVFIAGLMGALAPVGWDSDIPPAVMTFAEIKQAARAS